MANEQVQPAPEPEITTTPDMMDGYNPGYVEDQGLTETEVTETPVETEDPAEDPEPKTEEDTPATIRIGEEDVPIEEAVKLIERGRAAETLEVQATNYQNLETSLLGDNPDLARETLERLTELVNEHHGTPEPSFDEEYMTDTEKALSTQNKRLLREFQGLQSELAQVRATLKDLEPIHKEVVTKAKAEADVARVRQMLGVEVSNADIASARKATGIDDAAGAYSVWRAKQPSVNTPPKTPKSDERSSQPDMSDPDAIYRARMRKEVVTA